MTNTDRMKAECQRLGAHAADLQRELTAARARIAELEAERERMVLPKNTLSDGMLTCES